MMAERTQPGCVLVVDDEETIRDTLREWIELGGCSAIVASNGFEAMLVLSSCRPCLVIADLVMPVMSGCELIRTMQGNPSLAGIPIIVSTSAPGRAPSGVTVLSKPIDIAVLWEWIRRSCQCE
jgi:CheY-like chemotaxis protein